MATEGPIFADGGQCVAAADLSAKQFYAVKLTGARAVNLASTGGEPIYGTLQNKPKLGQAAHVAIGGVTKAAAGAAIAAAAEVMTDTTGRYITATTAHAAVGIALEAAGGAGIIFTMRQYDRGHPI